ncbi:hypothetical protein ACFQI7_22065 [Paenibacillus allorhizosphaerae]|uniref:Uncharacterized protein n=1 Tax=Paenibacillus allorhizosphaerae TaxID=2849866 RepID=A0ABN7TPY9_9BACL|nr:hypothetical protein [Paenibacillus allorhizosphaerae]CAG7650593.1 hypothetical protein PAECIP111802_04759 [Paenibacillus allorhizosphaerae]
MKINVKKVLFILVCAELMIWYYGSMELREPPRSVVLHDKGQPKKPELPTQQPEPELKKAS